MYIPSFHAHLTHFLCIYTEVNPCNNNLYSSFVKSEHSCDGPSRYYYTCESFEEMEVFANACAKHPDQGAKIDAPKVLATGHSRYKIWYKKVMKLRLEGAGREIMYDDETEESHYGMSTGGGNAGDAPVTDEELGNKVDPNQAIVGKEGLGRGATGAHIEYDDNNDDYEDQYEFEEDFNDYMGDYDEYNEYDNDNNMENEELYDYNFNENDIGNGFNDRYYELDSMESNHDKIETMIMGVWGIMISVLFICLCCVIAGVCGLLVKNMRKKWREDKHRKYLDDMRFVDLSDDGMSDILNDDEEENMHLNKNDNNNNHHRNGLLYQDSIA